MDQNLARLQNPHRFLRENRFLEGEDPSKPIADRLISLISPTMLLNL